MDDQHTERSSLFSCCASDPLLLPNEELNDPANDDDFSKEKPRVIVPKRTVIVEPLMIMFMFFALPSSMVSSQYILQAIRHELGVNETSNNSQCNGGDVHDPDRVLEAKAQSEAAYFQLYLDLLQGVPAAIIGIFLGNYSDKAGRKYAILPPCIGLAIKSLCYVMVVSLEANIYFLFIGSFIDGFFGSFTTLLCGCLAYVTDITDTEKRTFRITVVEMCMLLPTVISALATGYLIQAVGFLPPFIIILIGVSICAAYGIFFIPETIIKDPSARFFSVDHLKEAGSIYFKDTGDSRRTYLLLLLSSIVGPMLVSFSTGIDTLFQMNSPLCWNSVTIGIYNSAVLAVVTVGGLISAYFLRKCLSDAGMIILSGTFSTLSSLYKAVVRNTTMMFMSLLMSPLGFLYIPTLRSLMSKHVKSHEYGGMFAGIAAIEAFCVVVGKIIFSPIYAETNSIWSGAVFLVMGGCTFSGILLFLIYKCVKYRRDKSIVLDERSDSPEVNHPEIDPEISDDDDDVENDDYISTA